MNANIIMKLMNAKNNFDKNHPKVKSYFNAVKSKGIQEGAVVQIKITNPNDEPMIANIKVKESDIELFSSLGDLIK